MKRLIVAALLLVGTFTTSAQAFIGFCAGSGIEKTSGNASGIILGAGIDFGFINTSVGTFGLSASRSVSLGTATHTGLGIMYLADSWRESTALFLGVGIDFRSAVDNPYGQALEDDGSLRESIAYHDRQGTGLLLRAGLSFRRNIYVTGSVSIGGFTAEKDVYSMHHTPAGIHYDGYSSVAEGRSYLLPCISIGCRF